jgi:hypothetical protein
VRRVPLLRSETSGKQKYNKRTEKVRIKERQRGKKRRKILKNCTFFDVARLIEDALASQARAKTE